MNNAIKLDQSCAARIDADMTHHVDTPLRDDLHESRYSRLQAAHAVRLNELATVRDDLAAAMIRIECQAENLSFYAKTLAESEAARDRLIKENAVLQSKLDAHDRAIEYVMSNDDEAQAWAKFIGAWLFVIAFCVVGCAVTYWGFV